MTQELFFVRLTPHDESLALLRHALELSRVKVAQLEQALQTSRQIGAAVGILMATHRVTYDDAFLLLRATSQQCNIKLRQVAVDVVEQGCLPIYPHRKTGRDRGAPSRRRLLR